MRIINKQLNKQLKVKRESQRASFIIYKGALIFCRRKVSIAQAQKQDWIIKFQKSGDTEKLSLYQLLC